MMIQYTLSMEPAAIAPPRRRGRVQRKVVMDDVNANVLDQMHMVDQEGNTKSRIVEKSLRITAKLMNHAGSLYGHVGDG